MKHTFTLIYSCYSHLTGISLITELLSFCPVDFCMDENEHCNDWASKGECGNNTEYMLINCRKSCHNCGNI